MSEQSSIQVTKKRPFSAVPDDILTDKSLSLAARLVLAYLIGRPENWVIYVAQVQKAIGLSEGRWIRIRKELTAAGYYSQERQQNAGGKWVWTNTVSDTPTIPPKSMDGETMHGLSAHGKSGDIAEEHLASDFNKGKKTKGKERDEDAAHPHGKQRLPSHSSSSFSIDKKTGICLQAGNDLDASTLAAILKFDEIKVSKAVAQAKAEEKAGRAWPSIVLALLNGKDGSRKNPHQNQGRQIVSATRTGTSPLAIRSELAFEEYRRPELDGSRKFRVFAE